MHCCVYHERDLTTSFSTSNLDNKNIGQGHFGSVSRQRRRKRREEAERSSRRWRRDNSIQRVIRFKGLVVFLEVNRRSFTRSHCNYERASIFDLIQRAVFGCSMRSEITFPRSQKSEPKNQLLFAGRKKIYLHA